MLWAVRERRAWTQHASSRPASDHSRRNRIRGSASPLSRVIVIWGYLLPTASGVSRQEGFELGVSAKGCVGDEPDKINQIPQSPPDEATFSFAVTLPPPSIMSNIKASAEGPSTEAGIAGRDGSRQLKAECAIWGPPRPRPTPISAAAEPLYLVLLHLAPFVRAGRTRERVAGILWPHRPWLARQ
jgi:hypothetical protein